MNITIAGKHVETSDAFRQHLIDGIEEHVVEKYKIEPIEITAVITKVRHMFECDLNVHLGKGVFIRVEGHGSDAYECADNAVSKLADRVRKHKNKLKDLKHKKDIEEIEEKLVSSYVISSDSIQEDDKDEDANPPVIAEMKIDVPSLSVNDAIMHMDLSGDELFVFKNKNNKGINILFKRNDGNIGWIDVNKNENA